MSGTIIIIMGVALFFNIAIIYHKINIKQTTNASIDATILGFTLWIFSGTFAALAMGTIASAMFSLYLMFNPPNVDWFEE